MGGAKSSATTRSGGIVAAAPSPPPPVLPPGVRITHPRTGAHVGSTKYQVRVDSHTLDFYAEKGGGYLSYSFGVDDSLSRNPSLDPAVGRQVANQALRIARYDVSTRPEGTVMTVSAVTWDGSGASRARAYTAFGFSQPDRPGDSQYAVKRNGRLQPISRHEFETLRRQNRGF